MLKFASFTREVPWCTSPDDRLPQLAAMAPRRPADVLGSMNNAEQDMTSMNIGTLNNTRNNNQRQHPRHANRWYTPFVNTRCLRCVRWAFTVPTRRPETRSVRHHCDYGHV